MRTAGRRKETRERERERDEAKSKKEERRQKSVLQAVIAYLVPVSARSTREPCHTLSLSRPTLVNSGAKRRYCRCPAPIAQLHKKQKTVGHDLLQQYYTV